MEAQELYEIILRTANSFLHNAKHFSIEILREENPTYEELAEIALKIAKLLEVFADDFDPMMHVKANEYAQIMHKMGQAINRSDEDGLKRHLKELDMKPLIYCNQG